VEAEAEGELYRIREVAEDTLDVISPMDSFLAGCIKEHGRDTVVNRLAAIMRRVLGNEASGMFKLTEDGIQKSITECRKYFLDQDLIDMIQQGKIDVSLDRDGQMCFNFKKQ